MFSQIVSLCEMFPWAIVTGTVIASVCAFLGVFVVLRRVVFVGITLSEVAACGVAGALVLEWPPLVGASALTLIAVVILAQPFELRHIPRDAVLGVIFVAAGAGAILLVATSGFGLHKVKMLLYGDLILASKQDAIITGCVLVPVFTFCVLFLRPILYTFLDREAARTMEIHVRAWELGYFVALGMAVSAASQIAGTLLVFCYLVVAPSAALMLTHRFTFVLISAIAVAVGATWIGLFLSFGRNLPTNQTIGLVTCLLFVGVIVVISLRAGVRFWRRR